LFGNSANNFFELQTNKERRKKEKEEPNLSLDAKLYQHSIFSAGYILFLFMQKLRKRFNAVVDISRA